MTIESAIEESMPIFKLLLGSRRSPDMAAPASMPVTAGKNIAKTTQNGAFSNVPHVVSSAGPSLFPIKKEKSDITIRNIMRYCTFIATLALSREVTNSSKRTPDETKKALCSGKRAIQPSVNPTIYIAAPSA